MREPRLGDIIDDFCIKCKRIMNHAVVSLLNGEPAKVRCRTCHNDHDYRHEQPPPPKVDTRKAALFNEVLAKVDPGSVLSAAEPEPFLLDPVDEIPADEEPPEEPFAEDRNAEAMAEPPAPKPEKAEKAKPKKAKAAPKPAAKSKSAKGRK